MGHFLSLAFDQAPTRLAQCLSGSALWQRSCTCLDCQVTCYTECWLVGPQNRRVAVSNLSPFISCSSGRIRPCFYLECCYATHSSSLVCEIPGTEEPSTTGIGVTKSWTRLSDWTTTTQHNPSHWSFKEENAEMVSQQTHAPGAFHWHCIQNPSKVPCAAILPLLRWNACSLNGHSNLSHMFFSHNFNLPLALF